MKRDTEYARLLKSQQLWPVDPLLEQDWSGRGQHTEFEKHEQKLINELLEVQENLGTTRTAIVQSVKCRRILLARKTITCGKRTMTKEEAVAEISHLTQLSHAHILRVIGTYVKGRELSILLYPVADCNLEVFLDHYREMRPYSDQWLGIAIFLERCASCLSSAVRYIHRNLTKHMDIKPQNILILNTGPANYAPFIADFGIARSYDKLEDVETDGETSFTRRYAAPEVVKQEPRGLPADIFSLGCVFFEIFASTYGNYVRDEDFIELRDILKTNSEGDTSYQANIDALQAQLSKIPDLPWSFSLLDPLCSLIKRMLRHGPEQRPSAEDLVVSLGERYCCMTGSVALQALAKERLDSNI
jgi:serine/threonine protein kinase